MVVKARLSGDRHERETLLTRTRWKEKDGQHRGRKSADAAGNSVEPVVREESPGITAYPPGRVGCSSSGEEKYAMLSRARAS